MCRPVSQVEMCEALRRSVAALRQEKEALCEEQRHHQALGASIETLVQERLKTNERDKYSMFIGETADCHNITIVLVRLSSGEEGQILTSSDFVVSAGDLEKIVNLLLSLCSRLSRIDRSLLALEREELTQEDTAEERVRRDTTGSTCLTVSLPVCLFTFPSVCILSALDSLSGFKTSCD